jgi:hypothetical protein
VACVMVLFGLTSLSKVRQPMVFDRTTGRFGRGRISGANAGPHKHGMRGRSLEKIHALQLLWEGSGQVVPSAEAAYHVNLVLDGGERVSVLRSKNEEDVVRVAMTLSRFLDRPVWDAR